MTAGRRFLSIDLLRSAAILGMIIYHGAYDLREFKNAPLDPFSGGWLMLQRSVAITFLLLVGISAVLSSAKGDLLRRFLKRAVIVEACALIVTIVTFFFDRVAYVRFGILHMIALSLVLLPLFLPIKRWNLLFGLLVVVFGTVWDPPRAETTLLLPLGIMPRMFQSIDYFPLIPWFGVVLIGAGLGVHLFEGKTPRLKANALTRVLAFPGKHSLLIYMVHQPVLLGLLNILPGKM